MATVVAFVIAIGFAAAFMLCKGLSDQSSTWIMSPIATIEEVEEAKKYAILFGIDNETVDVDIFELLKMGRKMSSYMGDKKVEEIHAAIVRAKIDHYFYQDPESKGNHHRINNMMKAHDLVAVMCTTAFIRLNKMSGGDRSEEPSIV